LGGKGPVEKLQIGVGARHGDRDPDYVGYDYPGITSGQGFTLWSPGYNDAGGRHIHILPSGAQNAIGGELRLPVSIVELRGEAYYVANNTREAVEGFQLTNTERLGVIRGLGWYAQLSAWPLGDTFVNGDPGMYRPRSINLKEAPKIKKGLEVAAMIAGINAKYDGASRQGVYDAKTPGGSSGATDITVYQYAFGANYWYTKLLRFSLDYAIYHTPGSASADNLALVPGNLGKEPDVDAHLLHELSTRAQIAF
jgi:hypothetical protein